MTLLAGVFSRTDTPLDEAIVCTLRNNLSRNPSDQVEAYQDSRVCLMKVDVGAFGVPGVYRGNDNHTVSLLAGEPLLKSSDGRCRRTRDVDLEEIHRDLGSGSLRALQSATGVFSVAHYDRSSGRLTLATDKIGLRAIFYRIDERQVVFASVLRLLEDLPLPKTMDALTVTEMTVFPRHPLGTRTPYCEIKRMLSGELIEFQRERVRPQSYFDFGSIPQISGGNEQEFLRDSHERFMDAIRRRLGSDQTAAACLSGGLDSRAVVSGLRALNTRVFTVSMYQFYNSQDRVYAAMLAQAAGTVHTEIQVPEFLWGQKFENTARDTFEKAVACGGDRLERNQFLWTGHGGSVSSGHLLIEPRLADMLRRGRIKEAFLTYHLGGVNSKIMTGIADRLEQAMLDAFVEELREVQCPDPARAFHVFLIKNHQRKDFTQHFEHIDIHRLEFQSPFYDSDYLESIVRLPFEWTAAHRFYHKWMALFPPFATAVPWQTYDGHEACPLPAAPGVARQWDRETRAVGANARQADLMRRVGAALKAKSFPHPFIRRERLMLAGLLQWARLRFCGVAINTASAFCEYWNRCEGAFEIPAQMTPEHRGQKRAQNLQRRADPYATGTGK